MAFHKAAQAPFPSSAAWAHALFETCVRDPDKVAIVREGGVLLGVVGPSLLGPFRQAQEIAWWIDPEHRGGGVEMLAMYEAWAKDMRATITSVASLALFPEIEAVYQARGYQRLETHWVRVN